jgi:hypothetical protein
MTTPTIALPDVCPDPDRHAMWAAANDTTVRRRADRLPDPTPAGRCAYCSGSLPGPTPPGRTR